MQANGAPVSVWQVGAGEPQPDCLTLRLEETMLSGLGGRGERARFCRLLNPVPIESKSSCLLMSPALSSGGSRVVAFEFDWNPPAVPRVSSLQSGGPRYIAMQQPKPAMAVQPPRPARP